MRCTVRSISISSLPILLILLQGCADEGFETNESTAGLSLPEGFSAPVFADNVGRPRHIAVRENGDVSVAWRHTGDPGGLLALTEKICVFGTVHAPLINPVFAAKQIVTTDHIGAGRFGLNVVSGWNPVEFEMFGQYFPPR